MKKLRYGVVHPRAALPVAGLLILVLLSVWVGDRAVTQANANFAVGAMPLILLDAGHGGEDGGALSVDGTPEKDINLSLTLKLDELLRALGFRTKMTRTDDTLFYDAKAKTMREKKVSDIQHRYELMQQSPDCIFLSIHQNHYSVAKYDGAQVFYSGNHPQSEQLAQVLQSTIASQLQPENTRKIKQSGTEIYLLYHAQVPAVMVECGFLSNPREAQLLGTDDYQTKLAVCIANGLLEYFTNRT